MSYLYSKEEPKLLFLAAPVVHYATTCPPKIQFEQVWLAGLGRLEAAAVEAADLRCGVQMSNANQVTHVGCLALCAAWLQVTVAQGNASPKPETLYRRSGDLAFGSGVE